jgi:hypothetical protein
MEGTIGMLPDCRYELKPFAIDSERNNVATYAIVKGTHTGAGRPDRLKAFSSYVYRFGC